MTGRLVSSAALAFLIVACLPGLSLCVSVSVSVSLSVCCNPLLIEEHSCWSTLTAILRWVSLSLSLSLFLSFSRRRCCCLDYDCDWNCDCLCDCKLAFCATGVRCEILSD